MNNSISTLSRYEPLLANYSDFLDSCATPLPHVARINTIKTTVDNTLSLLSKLSINVTPCRWNPLLFQIDDGSPGNTLPYLLGWLHGQEEVSSIPPLVLNPQPGDFVWDACASPGSKTSQIAALMNDIGLIVANDSNLRRMPALRSNLERLGVTIAAVTHSDARHFSLKPFEFDLFDSALVDVPCSGEGTIRKNPVALKNWSIDQLFSLQKVQMSILKRAIGVVKSGGTVVYSTCTFSPEENEMVIDRILSEEKCKLVPFDLPMISSPGVTEWGGNQFNSSLDLCKRIWPNQNNTGGFFVAKLEVL
tara:strand:- start:30052 stop:30969 length:918 start_codon:yes stop_codon:yes gene_type:complete